MEGCFPETWRGLAMAGAEIIYRASIAEPWVGRGDWEIQNRGGARNNCCYAICPNHGPQYGLLTKGITEHPPRQAGGGYSMIVDHRGNIISCVKYGVEGWAATQINIDELRDFRSRATFGHWLPFLRTEIFAKIYEKPIYPKNLDIDKPRTKHAEKDQLFWATIQKLQEMDIYHKEYAPPEITLKSVKEVKDKFKI
jgi:hypothetical protein